MNSPLAASLGFSFELGIRFPPSSPSRFRCPTGRRRWYVGVALSHCSDDDRIRPRHQEQHAKSRRKCAKSARLSQKRSTRMSEIRQSDPENTHESATFVTLGLTHPANGSRTRMVSSRSGLVLTSATGQRISSSMRRTYLIACAGKSAQLRAPAVVPSQPSISS